MNAPGYLDLLRRNVPLRNLWLGQVVSFFGDWFKTIALLTIVQQFTSSAQALALVLVARMLPIFLVTPIAGPLVDRFDRRKIMLATDIARAVLALGLVVAHRLENLPLLFSLLVLMVGISGIFIPARTAAIPQLTERHELPAAVALSGGTWSIMLAFGAAVGGVITHFLGVDTALVLDGVTYLVSAYFIRKLPDLPPRERADAQRTSFRAGIRYLARRPYLAGVVSLKAAMSVAAGVVAILPLYARAAVGVEFDVRKLPLLIGALYAFRGVGSVIGTMGVRRMTGDHPEVLRGCIAVALVVSGAAYVGLGFAPGFWVAGWAYLIGALGTGTVWVFASILGQIASDQEYRGRVFSMEFAGMTLMFSVISWVAGYLVDATAWTHEVVAYASGAALLLPAAGWLVLLALTRPTGDGVVPLADDEG